VEAIMLNASNKLVHLILQCSHVDIKGCASCKTTIF